MVKRILVNDYDMFGHPVENMMTIFVRVGDESIDLLDAVKQACKYYVTNTDAGREMYEYSGHQFRWRDFYDRVPNEICRQFGFEKIEPEGGDIVVDWDDVSLAR